MGVILLYILILLTAVSTLFQSWVGVVAYYTLSLWYPQIIWYYIFGNIRVVFIVSLVTIASFVKDLLLGKVKLNILKEKQNIYMLILWLSLFVSFFFSPYGSERSEISTFSSSYLISNYSNIFIFYFISIFLIDTREQFHFLILVFVVTTLYYIYWANNMYFSGGMRRARLAGPGGFVADGDLVGGPYTDENTFAMLFVAGIPFLYFMGNYYKNFFLKYFLWGCIPAGWHAIFLTGSLGGLIGLGFVTGFIALRSKRKLFLVGVPIALLVAFFWQGGLFVHERLQQVEVISDAGEISTAQQRIEAWKAGIGMLIDHPITGVGLGRFVRAYPLYSDTNPHVAHNTFFQFASEAGLLAGAMYLLLFYNIICSYLKQIKLNPADFDELYLAARESIMGGAMGFFICATFLNLATFEVFYYLLVLNMVQNRLVKQPLAIIGSREPELEFAR